MIHALERFDAIGRMKPSRKTAPATAPPSPQATMAQEVLAMCVGYEVLVKLTRDALLEWD
jgi:hypothetical protein